MSRGAIVSFAAALLVVAAAQSSLVAAEVARDVPGFLAAQQIDRAQRAALEEATAWGDDAEAVLVKVLARLEPPRSFLARWREGAAPLPPTGTPVEPGDSLKLVRGRATFVAPRVLAEPLATLAGRPGYDLVRITDAGGQVVDAVLPRAPASWPRWKAIDEPVEVLVLPLATKAEPSVGEPAAGGDPWPQPAPAALVAAVGLSWSPDTPAGRAGVNYALFDTVADGKPMAAGDTDAFYALLAVAGRVEPATLAAEAGSTDVMQLIDPRSGWFPARRGDPAVIKGNVLRATRVAIDDDVRRRETGLDHYWELYVFVETPRLDVDGRLQDTYPIVCCVRSLPAGMPTGDKINEPVRVAGYTLKRYAYSFEEPTADGAERERRLTTLLVGPEAEWLTQAGPVNASIYLYVGIAALAALAAIYALGVFSGSRSIDAAIRKTHQELPDRVDLPGDRP